MVEKTYFGEGKNIEFKRQIPTNHEKFLKDIIAFSNTSGGKVILGIEDETREVVGIGDEAPFKLSDRISTMISDACTPQIDPDITICTVEEKTLLEISVAPGKFRPYYLTGKGKETSTYIRINGTSRPADARRLKELELEGQNMSYDKMQCIGNEYNEAKALQLCHEMNRIALDACKSEDEKTEVKAMTIEKLEDFGILYRVGQKLCVTNAFDLLTDNKNRNAKIQCGLFKGTTRDIFIDQKEFTGPIYAQVEDAYRFILRHINLGAEISGMYRSDEYELPINAIREMVANAVVHRSYLDESCIQICVFDDRIEVISPGTLYGGLDIETAKLGKSRCRNEAIAEAFHYMRIIESWGTGLPRMIRRCEEYGLPKLLFEEFGDSFKVTMFRKLGDASEKLGDAPEKLGDAPEKLGDASEKLGDAPEKLGDAPEKLGDAPEKVDYASENMADSFERYKLLLKEEDISDRYIANIKKFYHSYDSEIFMQGDVQAELNCSDSKAANIMRTMRLAGIIQKVSGYGPGKYKFIE